MSGSDSLYMYQRRCFRHVLTLCTLYQRGAAPLPACPLAALRGGAAHILSSGDSLAACIRGAAHMSGADSHACIRALLSTSGSDSLKSTCIRGAAQQASGSDSQEAHVSGSCSHVQTVTLCTCIRGAAHMSGADSLYMYQRRCSHVWR
ncbi:hypothetical protein RRG08_024212 [Elysia crispata]|uniref:Uncharacterized protein n=1 Tax=Elysia crispata TaxID=231223 RepID=A0AAE0YQK5_9GAST|nr:hypothetical protein RRG08_024212 [Elysia crispata]